MSRFLSHWKKDLASPVPLVLWVVLTVIVTLAGPFGTLEELRLPARLLFWAIVIGGSLLVGTGCRAFVEAVIGWTDFRRGAPTIAILVSAVCTGPIYFASTFIVDPGDPRTLDFGETALFIAAVSLGVGAFRQVLGRPDADPIPPIPVQEDYSSALPRLLERLPSEARGPLVSISGRNHYVDVVTDNGKASLLMRFADALAETEPADGAQVHRSHWVAWASVRSAGRDGTKIWVELHGGTRLPVSRNHRGKLEERGLL